MGEVLGDQIARLDYEHFPGNRVLKPVTQTGVSDHHLERLDALDVTACTAIYESVALPGVLRPYPESLGPRQIYGMPTLRPASK